MVHGRRVKILATFATILGAGIVSTASEIEAVPGEFLIKAKDAKIFRLDRALQMFSAQEIRVVSKKENIFLVKRNILERREHAMASLRARPGIEIVEPNYIYRVNRMPNDPKFGELWGLKNYAQKGGREGIDVGAEQAWDIETGKQDVVVAVIDTGVDYTHADLSGNIWINEAEKMGRPGVDDDGNGYVDDIHGYDFVNRDGDPMDDHGHGTHCSGTIGAKGDDNQGIVGVNWNVRIMAVKFLSAQGSGSLEDAIKAIDYATAMGAHIESNSWGGGGYTELLKQAIERARDKNVLFVAAAGNETNNNDTSPSYPATYNVANVMSVAAVDNAGQLAYFSNYGKTTVHIAAPGVDVTSSVPKDTNPEGYDTWSGTSMATPHVAGVAALLKAHNFNLTYAEIKKRLMDGARVLGSLRNKVVSNGIVNAYYSLSETVPPVDMEDPYNWATVSHSTSSNHPYADNGTVEFTVKVEGAKQVAAYFDKFETEQGYDIVTFKDSTGKVVGKWSGIHSGEFSPPAQGDTLHIILTSDNTINGYGFDVTAAAYR